MDPLQGGAGGHGLPDNIQLAAHAPHYERDQQLVLQAGGGIADVAFVGFYH